MSKWNLLRSSFDGNRGQISRQSIHRHEGYKLISRKRAYWRWQLHITIQPNISVTQFIADCEDFMKSADTVELNLFLTADGDAITSLFRFISIRIFRRPQKNIHGRKITSHCLWVEVTMTNYSVPILSKDSEFWEYFLYKSNQDKVSIFTRERPRNEAIKVMSLRSHELYGVDNTGLVRVWVTEQVLLHTLLTQRFANEFTDKHILELGGGMTGMCGLGLAAATSCASVVITDGHPDCFANQKTCIRMCQQKNAFRVPVDCCQLRWLQEDPYQELQNTLHILSLHHHHQDSNSTSSTTVQPQLNGSHHHHHHPVIKFDIIIASDCLFFKEFHSDLLWTIEHSLAKHGKAFLLQPRRGGTMQKFIALAQVLFHCEVIEDYSSQVTALHHQYLTTQKDIYDPDIHQPILIIMTFKNS